MLQVEDSPYVESYVMEVTTDNIGTPTMLLPWQNLDVFQRQTVIFFYEKDGLLLVRVSRAGHATTWECFQVKNLLFIAVWPYSFWILHFNTKALTFFEIWCVTEVLNISLRCRCSVPSFASTVSYLPVYCTVYIYKYSEEKKIGFLVTFKQCSHFSHWAHF